MRRLLWKLPLRVRVPSTTTPMFSREHLRGDAVGGDVDDAGAVFDVELDA
jgi:hypothetical protein